MKARELKVGDRLMAEDGVVETIRQIGKGMIRRFLNLTYKSGRWSELHPEDEVDVEL